MRCWLVLQTLLLFPNFRCNLELWRWLHLLLVLLYYLLGANTQTGRIFLPPSTRLALGILWEDVDGVQITVVCLAFKSCHLNITVESMWYERFLIDKRKPVETHQQSLQLQNVYVV